MTAADDKKAKQIANLAKARAAAKANREAKATEAELATLAAKAPVAPVAPVVSVEAATALADALTKAIAAKEAAPIPAKEPEKRVKIILEDSEEIPGDDANKRVFIGYNGKNFGLRPGREANVPVGVLGILNDATFSVAEKDPNTLKLTGKMRDKRRFSYRLVG